MEGERKKDEWYTLSPQVSLRAHLSSASPATNQQTTVWDSNDSNKTRMGFALSRDLFYLGFFGGHVIKHGQDWIGKTWTGLIKHEVIKHGEIWINNIKYSRHKQILYTTSCSAHFSEKQ